MTGRIFGLVTVAGGFSLAAACGSAESSPGSATAGTDSGPGTTTTGSGGSGEDSSGGTRNTGTMGTTGDPSSGGANSGSTSGATGGADSDSGTTSDATGGAGLGGTSSTTASSSGGASSGAAGESSNTGGTDSGGSDSGGTGGSGGSGGSNTGGTGGSGGGPTGVVEEPGSECDTPAELACAGNHQRVSLICIDGTWQVNETCPENHACDTTPGFDQGTCKERLPECVDQEPGQGAMCEDSTTLLQCGPDNVTLVPVECEGSCHEGACDNRPNHCPVETFINCGSECGEMSPNCMEHGNCDVQPGLAWLEFEEPGQSHVVRIGEYAARCEVSCDARETRGFRLFTRTGNTTMRWRITVPAPLRLVESGYCVEQGTEGCVVVGPDSGDIILGTVITDDPAAPEANILVESAAEGEMLECP